MRIWNWPCFPGELRRPHNYHLPYGTDVIEADHVAAAAAEIAWSEGARVIVLPTIPFGVNTGQSDYLPRH